METSIKWFYDRLGKVTYSMVYRNGPSSYDCSSAVYYALISGGLLPRGTKIGNTDSMFGDLERNGWSQVPADRNGYVATKRGDVFIWGKRGASGGAAGHTGIFVNANDIIHCAYGYNGIHVDNHDNLSRINGWPALTVYRKTGATLPPAMNETDQVVEVGSHIKFTKIYAVNDIQHIHGVWQVRTSELCKNGFTWGDNGIPAGPLVEVKDGYMTDDQSLDVGSLYVIPGKFKVLDLGYSDGMWLAMIEWNGMKFWVDIETATEVKSSDAGTPTPGKKPTPPKEEKPTEPSKPVDPPIVAPVDPPKEETPQPPKVEQPTEKPKEEEKEMAYSKEDIEALKIATERAQLVADGVAASDEVKEIVSGISRRTKVTVYIIGDTLIGLGVLAPSVVVALGIGMDISQLTAISGTFATAGAFLLTMFGIFKSGNK